MRKQLCFLILAMFAMAFAFVSCGGGGGKTVSVTGVSLNKNTMTLTAGSSETLTPTITPSNATNKGVAWTSSNDAIASVSGGRVTAIVQGSATITVRTNDGNHTATCAVTVNPVPPLPIAVTGVTLNKNTMSLALNGAEQLTLAIQPPNATNQSVTWETSDGGKATVTNGLVTAVAQGGATITVRTADGNHTAICNVSVAPAPIAVSNITLNKNTMTLAAGDAQGALSPTIMPINATNQNITWSSGNTSVATVSNNGIVTPLSVGNTTIRATTQDGSKTAECAVTVTAAPIPATDAYPNKYNMTLGVNGADTFIATFIPNNATNQNVVWISSNPAVAVVSSAGVVTALAPGMATINAVSQVFNNPSRNPYITARGTVNDSGDSIFPAPLTVTVPSSTVAATGVTLDKNTIALTVGNFETLSPTIQPYNATNQAVNWISSDTSIAVVSSSGAVTALAPGMAVITVATRDGGNMASCTVTVTPAVTPIHPSSVTLDKTSMTLSVGGTGALTATVLPEDATNKNIYWTSSNQSAAVVSSTGLVTAVAQGSATITVHTVDGNRTAACAVTVASQSVAVTGVTLNKNTLTLSEGASEGLIATVQPNSATNKNVTWTSNNANTAVVSSAGLVTAIAPGAATITVRTNDGGYTATCAVTVTIPVSGVTLNKNTMTLMPMETETLTATVLPEEAANKNVAWQSSNTNVATVTSAGLVTGIANGIAAITARTDDGNYLSTCDVTVVNVYVAGTSSDNYPTLWKNGAPYNLMTEEQIQDYMEGQANSVFVTDNGDVYVGGTQFEYDWDLYDQGIMPYWRYYPVVWKNGLQHLQSISTEFTQDIIYSIHVSGDYIYAAGDALRYKNYPVTTNADMQWYARHWMNGNLQELEVFERNEDYYWSQSATSVFVSGDDVYVTGIDMTFNTAGILRNVAVLWKNGQAQYLSDPDVGGGVANSIFVSGSDVYVGGTESVSGQTHPTIWKNGVAQHLGVPEGALSTAVRSVFVSGGNVYAAGTVVYSASPQLYAPALWKNGVPQILGEANGMNYADSVYVFGDDVFVAGYESEMVGGNYVATLWKNGEARRLGYGQAISVCVSAAAPPPGL